MTEDESLTDQVKRLIDSIKFSVPDSAIRLLRDHVAHLVEVEAELEHWRSGRRRKGLRQVEAVPDGIQYAAALARSIGTAGGDDHDRLLAEAAQRLKALADAGSALLAEAVVLRGRLAEVEALPGDPHPESYCHRCGGPNVSWWSAPSPLWNAVMRGNDINAADDFDGIVCPTCFAGLAKARAGAEGWRFYANVVRAELTTVTPSGRAWDPESWLWVEPVASESAEVAESG